MLERKQVIIIFIIFACTALIITPLIIMLVQFDNEIPHSPISIIGDSAFTELNGVVIGDGSPENPYVIEGWDILAPSNDAGIYIRDTTAHFVVREVDIHSDHTSIFGINLENVRNGCFEHIESKDNWNGIRMDYCIDVSVAHCDMSSNLYGGIEVFRSENITISDNLAESNDWNLNMWDSTGCAITGNEFREKIVKIEDTSDTIFSGNVLDDCQLYVSDCVSMTIADNIMDKPPIIYPDEASSPEVLIEFAPPHSNSVIDIDDDALFEYLTVQVGINVSEPGWYFVVGVIYTNLTRWSSSVWDSNYSSYEIGTFVSELKYSAFDIVSNALNGTYYAALELYDRNSIKIATCEYTLGNYSILDFDETPLTALEGPHSDEGLDSDGDGILDYLAISVRVNVTYPGSYGVKAYIDDLTSNETWVARNSTYLECGIQLVGLLFSGELFEDAEMDGPYFVELDLMDADFNRFFMSDSFMTEAYDWSQFSNTGTSFAIQYSDPCREIDGDVSIEYNAICIRPTILTSSYSKLAEPIFMIYDLDRLWCKLEHDTGNWTVSALFSDDIIKTAFSTRILSI